MRVYEQCDRAGNIFARKPAVYSMLQKPSIPVKTH